MRGHLKKRGGNYHIVVYLGTDPTTDKPVYKWYSANKLLGRKAGKKEAEDLLSEIVKQVNQGTYVVPEKITFKKYLIDHWLPHIKTTVAQSTYSRYEGITRNYLIPNLGHLEISKIRPLHLQKLYSSLLNEEDNKKTLSGRSVRYIHVTAHKALSQAISWQMILTNPAEHVDLPKHEKREMRVWEQNQVKEFLNSVKEHRYYPIYVLAFSTGMRQSELLGLRWQDIDLNQGTVAVRRVYTNNPGQGVKFKDPKTKNSRRSISLPEGAVKVLKSHQAKQKEEWISLPYTQGRPELVFTSKVGTPILAHNLIRHFNSSQEKLNKEKEKHSKSTPQEAMDLPPLRFHEARHTHATLLLKSDVHAKIVSERLGHANISITMDLYSHVLPTMQKDAAEKINSHLF